jgi:hypothetical protein
MPRLTGEQLDDLIAVWHDCEHHKKQPAASWLELTQEQYVQWVNSDEPPQMSEKAYEKAMSKWNRYCSIEGATK